MCLFVGLVGQSDSFRVVGGSEDSTLRNEFGLAFRRAAQMTRARVTYHGFDHSVVEVAQADRDSFMDALHQVLSS